MLRSTIASMFVIVAGLALPAALAQDAPKKVQRAADKLFPDGKAQVSAGREINGVQTYDATARDGDAAESRAILTEYGDILVSSELRTRDTPPQPVQRVVDGLFGMDAREFSAVSHTYYFVDADLDGKPYHLKLDATGRLRDVQTTEQARMRDPSSLEKVSDEGSQRAQQYVRQWHEGAKISGVYDYPDIEGYYLVQYDDEDGNRTQTILNDQGRVYYEFTELDRDELPQPVQQTMSQMFKGARITDVRRASARYYQFEDEVNGSALTVNIRPNGDVVGISSEAEDDERAITAAARSKARANDADRSDRKADKADKADKANRSDRRND